MKLVVCGKGGSGKCTVSAMIAREMAEGLKEDSDRPNEQRTNGGAK